MAIEIIKTGLLTTIQDLGRFGFRKAGIICSGAMDVLALRLGNLLIGNAENEAGLECTLLGPEIKFRTATSISLTGGNLSPKLNGLPVKMWSPLSVKEGDVLQFGKAVLGCRTYICFSSGFDISDVIGSKSTYLKAAFGGWKGRRLHKNDIIPIKDVTFKMPEKENWYLGNAIYPDLKQNCIRVIKGPEFDWFTEKSLAEISSTNFSIGSDSDRMGYRLNSYRLERSNPKELLSSAVTFGTVQVSNDGHLILLMADHQTTGGYPRILQVASVDFSVLAQAQAGKEFRFEMVSEEEARQLLIEREQEINKLKQTLQLKFDLNGA
ncbi:biotin-dependent carboxyltransferase family protein [Pedobacter sp. AW1-32]|uniref:biotin-dependent carboxyltransferase family protein n=1 Tax=Pedobacter sp. AW1-32 TaxID=3383026 RepID=UPI003FF0F4DA